MDAEGFENPKLEPLQCPKCNRVYSQRTRDAFEKHVRICGKAQYKCVKCGKKYLTSHILKRHQRSHISTPYVCTVCDKKFKTKFMLLQHSETHKDLSERVRYNCGYCEKTFIHKPSLSRHLQKHFIRNSASYICGCGKALYNYNHFYRHRKACMDGVGMFTPSKFSGKLSDSLHRCQMCNCGFKDRAKLDEHVTHCDPFPGVENDKPIQNCDSIEQQSTEDVIDKDFPTTEPQETGTSIKEKKGNKVLPDLDSKNTFEVKSKENLIKETLQSPSRKQNGKVSVVNVYRVEADDNSATSKVEGDDDQAPSQNESYGKRTGRKRKAKQLPEYDYGVLTNKQTFQSRSSTAKTSKDNKNKSNNQQGEKKEGQCLDDVEHDGDSEKKAASVCVAQDNIPVSEPERAIEVCKQSAQNDVAAKEKGNNKGEYSGIGSDIGLDAEFEVDSSKCSKKESNPIDTKPLECDGNSKQTIGDKRLKKKSNPDDTDPIESDQAPSHETSGGDGNKELKSKCSKRTKVNNAYGRHYICKTENCSQRFKTITELFEHKNQDHKESSCYICSVCRKQFRQMGVYLSHLRMEHSDLTSVPLWIKNTDIIYSVSLGEKKNTINVLVCTQCGYRYLATDDPSHDCKPVSLLYFCPCCQFTSKSRTEITEHITGKHAGKYHRIQNQHLYVNLRQDADIPSQLVKDNTTACEQCDTKFATNEELRQHVDEKHANYPFACGLCFTCYGRRSALTGHLKLHLTPQFKCEICYKEFYHRFLLKTHMVMHSADKPFQCEHCGNRYWELNALKKHIMLKHLDDYRASYPDSRTDQSAALPLVCHMCGKSFSATRYLQKHMKTHFQTNLFKCAVCEETFANKQDYNNHKLEHNTIEISQNLSSIDRNGVPKKSRDSSIYVGIRGFEEGHRSGLPYYCSLCNDRFATVKQVNFHIHNRHLQDKDKSYKCHICEKGFTRRSGLRNHMRFHTNSKPYRCKICRKTFKQLAHVRQHLLSHGETRYKCKLCSKEFTNRGGLRAHVLIHCDILPFKCPFSLCKEAYYNLFKLWQHFSVCSKSISDKALECGLCHETFCKDRIMLHYQDHENDEHFRCDRCGQTFKTYPKLYFHKESKEHFNASELSNESSANNNHIPFTNADKSRQVSDLCVMDLMSQYDYVEHEDKVPLGQDDNVTDLYRTQSNTADNYADNPSGELLGIAEQLTHMASSVQMREVIVPASHTSEVDIEVVNDEMQELQTTHTEVQSQLQPQELDAHNYGKTDNLTSYQYVTDINVEETLVATKVNTDMRIEDLHNDQIREEPNQTLLTEEYELDESANIVTNTDTDNDMRHTEVEETNKEALDAIDDQEEHQSENAPIHIVDNDGNEILVVVITEEGEQIQLTNSEEIVNTVVQSGEYSIVQSDNHIQGVSNTDGIQDIPNTEMQDVSNTDKVLEEPAISNGKQDDVTKDSLCFVKTADMTHSDKLKNSQKQVKRGQHNIVDDAERHVPEYSNTDTHVHDIHNTNTETIQHIATTDTQNLQHITTSDTQDVQDILNTNTQNTQGIATTDTENVQHITTTDTENVQHITTTYTQNVQHITTTDTENVQHIITADTQNVQYITTTDTQNLQHITTTDSQNVLHITTTDTDNIQHITTTDTENVQHIITADTQNVEHITTTDTQNAQHITTTGTQNVQRITTADTQNVQHIATTDTQNAQHITTTDTQNAQYITTTDIQNVQHITTTDTQNVQHITTTDTQNVQHIITTDTQNVQHITTSDTQNVQHIATTDTQNAQHIAITDTQMIQYSQEISNAEEILEEMTTPNEKKEEMTKDLFCFVQNGDATEAEISQIRQKLVKGPTESKPKRGVKNMDKVHGTFDKALDDAIEDNDARVSLHFYEKRPGEAIFKCSVCPKTFAAIKYRNHHEKTHLKNTERKYQCPECGAGFNTPNTLKIHMRIHSNERPYVCDRCNKTFSQRGHLITHRRTHFAYYPFQCDFCKKKFISNANLKHHVNQAHNKELEAPHTFQCSTCKMHFKDEIDLKIHRLLHLQTTARLEFLSNCNGIEGFQVSEEIFEQIRGFDSEKDITKAIPKLKQFICETCGTKVFGEVSLKIHNSVHHPDIAAFSCEVCKSTFADKAYLDRHMLVHSGHTVCDVCGSFVKNESMKNHMIRHANRFSRNYQCKFCGKQFKLEYSFLKHLMCCNETEMNELLDTCTIKEPSVTVCGELGLLQVDKISE